jgi:hypothetical protein
VRRFIAAFWTGGGVEINDGEVVLGSLCPGAGVRPCLTLNGGHLLLTDPGVLTVNELEGTGGLIYGSGSISVTLNDASHPAIFAGTINVPLILEGKGTFTVTGTIGASVEFKNARLQIGDGQTNGTLDGYVYVGSANGLTFAVDNNDNNAWQKYRCTKQGEQERPHCSAFQGGKMRERTGEYGAYICNMAA